MNNYTNQIQMMTDDTWDISEDLFAAYHDIETGLAMKHPILFHQEQNGVIDLIPLFETIFNEFKPLKILSECRRFALTFIKIFIGH